MIITVLSFFLMLIDKQMAIHNKRRIPEGELMFFSLIGGSVGILVGMYAFNHKKKNTMFTLGTPLIAVVQLMIFSSIFLS